MNKKTKPFKKIFIFVLFLCAAFVMQPKTNAYVLKVDLDFETPGIQSDLTITVGQTINAAVFYEGDGASLFHVFLTDFEFNDSGNVLALAPSEPVLAAALPTQAEPPYTVLDPMPTSPGTPIGMGTGGAFTANTGAIGFSSATLGSTALPAGVDVSVFIVKLVASEVGTSDVGLFGILGNGVPGGFPTIALDGSGAPLYNAVTGQALQPQAIETATVTVIPEPSTVTLLLIAGLGGTGLFLRRRRV